MASIFTSSETPGKIITTTAKSVAPLTLVIETQYRTPGTNVVFKTEHLSTLGLCTGLDIQQSVAAQFQNTFENTIYVTPFGDLPGTASVSFILNATKASVPGVSGTAISDFFRYRLQPSYYVSSTLYRSPNIMLSVGGVDPIKLYGYLIGMQLKGSTGGSLLVEGVLHMKVWKFD